MDEQQRTERRLAAILAADVAGYSRLMSRDEEGTLQRLKAPSRRADRAPYRRPPRPHRQAHRRRPAGRVRQRRRGGALRRRHPGRHGRPQPRRARRGAHRVPHRHQPRRRHHRGRRHLRRRRQHRRAPGGAGRAGRHLRVARGARFGARQARHRARGPGREAGQEHRPAGPRVPHRPGQRHGAHRRHPPCRTSPRSPCCPSPT